MEINGMTVLERDAMNAIIALSQSVEDIRDALCKSKTAENDPETVITKVITEEKKLSPVSGNDQAEFVGQIIDIFEDFLSEKGVTFPNLERDESEDDNAAIIYGSDYGYCQDRLEEMMRAWNILE